MFRAVIEEAAALASLALFVGHDRHLGAGVQQRSESRRRLSGRVAYAVVVDGRIADVHVIDAILWLSDRMSSCADSAPRGGRSAAPGETGDSRLAAPTSAVDTATIRPTLGASEGYRPMADPGFVHLHVHSSYSLLEGALTIARLAELAKADRQPALALTDTDNMFGALEFSEKLAGAGIQPIVGCALAVDFGDQRPWRAQRQRAGPQRPRIVLLAAREDGYRSLMRLNLARLPGDAAERAAAPQARLARGRDRRPRSRSPAAPAGRSTRRSPPGRADLAAHAARRAARGCSATGSMSSCSATARPSERMTEPALIDLAYAQGIPLVATNEPLFRRRATTTRRMTR